MIICVTGTNTDVGKTIATAALASVAAGDGVDVVVAKPIQTGEPDGQGDANTVARLTGLETKEFVRYPEPLAPNLSARRAGMAEPDRAELAAWIQGLDAPGRLVLVEGAGGLLVRLGDELTLADIAADLGAPLVVVTSMGLGSLNAAELTVEVARRRGLTVKGLVGGSLPEELDLATRLNLEEMEQVTGDEFWGALPGGIGKLEKGEFAAVAREVFPHVTQKMMDPS